MHAKFAFHKFIVLHTKVNVNVAFDINYFMYYILINSDMQLIAMHYIWNKLILSLNLVFEYAMKSFFYIFH